MHGLGATDYYNYHNHHNHNYDHHDNNNINYYLKYNDRSSSHHNNTWYE